MATSRIQFCSHDSAKSGESPNASAWHTPELFVAELPLPWPGDTLTGSNMPTGLRDVVYGRYETHGYNWGIIGCAPDEAYSVPGYYRVSHCTIAEGSLGRFQRRTFLVPQHHMTDAMAALFTGDVAPGVEEIQDNTRDILLCTQGSVDSCCAKYGYPLYKLMRTMANNSGSNVQVWRATHFGGHRFAPTFLDLPSGRYWGRVTPQDASALMHRTAPAEKFRHLYRGSATLAEPLHQAIEGALLAEIGWELDEAGIELLVVDQLADDTWHATISVCLADQTRMEFAAECIQTGMVTMKGHCNYDIVVEAPQFETHLRVLAPID